MAVSRLVLRLGFAREAEAQDQAYERLVTPP
jgi:hypothetical protein